MSDSKVTLYAVVGSQPCRAVMWLLKMKNVDYNFIKTMPGTDSRKAAFRKMNPNGSVPVLTDEDLVIWESGAMLKYLCEKYGWEDLYPKDIKQRSQVDQWLDWHHRNSREVQIGFCMPIMRPDLKKMGLWSKVSVLNGKNALRILEGHFKENDWLANGSFSIADIQCCQDIIQCREQYMDVLNFKKYPNIAAWCDRLEAVPGGNWLVKKLFKVGKWVQGLKAKRSKL